MFPFAVLTLVAAATVPADSDGPLHKSEEGYVQCYEPDDTAKTCQSLAAYKRNADGTWDNTAIVLLAPKQPITLETVTTVSVKHGAICGYIRSEDVLRGKLRISGQSIPPEKAAPILIKIAESMATLTNKEICTEYLPSQDDLLARINIEGGVTPIPDQRVRWMLPSDGYTVAPASTESATKKSAG